MTGRSEIEAQLRTWEARLADAARARRRGALDRLLGRPAEVRPPNPAVHGDLARIPALASTVRLSPIDTRKVEILAREAAWWRVAGDRTVATLTASARQRLTTTRPRLEGRACARGELSRLLTTCPDKTVRRAAWYAEEEPGAALLPILRDLVAARAEAADHGDAAGAVLDRMEVERAWLSDQLRALELATREPYLAALRATASAAGVDHPRPWDLPYLAASGREVESAASAVVQAKQAMMSIGFPREVLDLPRVHVVADLPMPACCIAVRPPDEVHVLWRVDPSRDAAGQLAHELTHAVAALVGPADHLLSLVPSVLDEAVAEAVVRLTTIPRPHLSAPGRGNHAFATLFTLRRNMLQAEWELRLHDRPDTDLRRLAESETERYLGCAEDPPSLRFAARSLLYTHPLEPVAYMLADVLATQLAAAARRADDRSPGAWLIDRVLRVGARHRWPALISAITGGRDLDPGPFLEHAS